MPQQLDLRGRYVRINEAKLRERANRKDDPRNIFYEAMLENDSYEAYEAAIGMRTLLVKTWRPPSLVSGHAEMPYARNDRGWIEDETGAQVGEDDCEGPGSGVPASRM